MNRPGHLYLLHDLILGVVTSSYKAEEIGRGVGGGVGGWSKGLKNLGTGQE